MNSMKPVNKDNRRSLYEYEYPVTKILVAHKDCEVGNHYHKRKEELFILVSGLGYASIGNKGGQMRLLKEYKIEKNVFHTFYLKKGAVLIGFCTRKYDPKDDYHG